MNHKKNNNELSVSEAIIKKIAASVVNLDYGNVVIKIHNAKIVQIEVTERKRFDELWEVEKGGGI